MTEKNFVKAGTKAAKAVSKISKAISKAGKIIRKAEEFYNTVNSIASVLRIVKNADFYLQLGKDMLNGDFDITDPKRCRPSAAGGTDSLSIAENKAEQKIPKT